MPETRRLLDSRLVHRQTFGALHSFHQLSASCVLIRQPQVGAVDSSYDAHDDSDAPTDVPGIAAVGGSAAFTSQRLKGVDRV